MTIGILALQGDYEKHQQMIASYGYSNPACFNTAGSICLFRVDYPRRRINNIDKIDDKT